MEDPVESDQFKGSKNLSKSWEIVRKIYQNVPPNQFPQNTWFLLKTKINHRNSAFFLPFSIDVVINLSYFSININTRTSRTRRPDHQSRNPSRGHWITLNKHGRVQMVDCTGLGLEIPIHDSLLKTTVHVLQSAQAKLKNLQKNSSPLHHTSLSPRRPREGDDVQNDCGDRTVSGRQRKIVEKFMNIISIIILTFPKLSRCVEINDLSDPSVIFTAFVYVEWREIRTAGRRAKLRSWLSNFCFDKKNRKIGAAAFSRIKLG